MKVILLSDIPKVGKKYEVKDFKEGYAQNVLLSKGLAELATPQALARVADRQAKMERLQAQKDALFAELLNDIAQMSLVVHVKANEKGHLFKAVSASDVVAAIKALKPLDVNEDMISMDHIKSLGSHTIQITNGTKVGKCTILVEQQ